MSLSLLRASSIDHCVWRSSGQRGLLFSEPENWNRDQLLVHLAAFKQGCTLTSDHQALQEGGIWVSRLAELRLGLELLVSLHSIAVLEIFIVSCSI